MKLSIFTEILKVMVLINVQYMRWWLDYNFFNLLFSKIGVNQMQDES